MIKNNVTVAILAGGKSSRMGEDKGLMYLNDKMLIEYVIDEVKKISDKIIIITNNPEYEQFGYSCQSDLIKNAGPLGGILTSLTFSQTRKTLILSCDSPFITSDVLSILIDKANGEDVLVFENNGEAEPLFAVYDKNCLEQIKELIKNNDLKMKNALNSLKTVLYKFDEYDFNNKNFFTNINTPIELSKHQKI
ncbi:MAG TPA: molybdenum cofactor guanylyltransferase [Ignavibacteria bacterium]|nr:molybdenum cofactor guanylyltransferase [Ignavibacteria bacterium]HQY52243.1 molybdenum cofactor guanylyltransferase [Ignavibacteria bacterium]HRA98799.1 molybdenum cofactor guanylyltransferase [Ignavibacteria bacterium]